MKILFINPWEGIIGPNVGMQQLVDESLHRGHEIHIITRVLDSITGEYTKKGVVFHRLEKIRVTPRQKDPIKLLREVFTDYLAYRKACRVAESIVPDVVCINGENMLFAPRVAKYVKSPSVTILRGARFLELGFAAKLFFSIQSRWVDNYIGVSRHVCDGLAGLGISAQKIQMVYNGVDMSRYKPESGNDKFRSDHNISPNHKIIGTVCHLVPRKGIHHLIEGLGILKKTYSGFVCLIAGPEHKGHEAYTENLHQRISDLNLKDNVKLLGQRDDVDIILKQVDVFVHPSETESFGRVIAEAMACGKPCIGFDVGAVPELIEDQKTGYIVKPYDTETLAQCISILLQDEQLCKEFGQAAYEKAVKCYDLKTNIAATMDVIERAHKK